MPDSKDPHHTTGAVGDDVWMPGTVSPLLVLLGSFAMLGAVMLLMRWAFGSGTHLPAPRVADPADTTGDGLLVEVARLPTEAAAQVLRSRLHRAGIRATIGAPASAPVTQGYRLLVFPDDVPTARIVLR